MAKLTIDIASVKVSGLERTATRAITLKKFALASCNLRGQGFLCVMSCSGEDGDAAQILRAYVGTGGIPRQLQKLAERRCKLEKQASSTGGS